MISGGCSDWDKIIELIHREVVPAQGCTEPVAVAYASALAVKELGAVPDSVEASLSRNVLKNGMSVGVPGTGLFGLDIAVAAGALAGDSGRGLEVLAGMKPERVDEAKAFIREGRVRILMSETEKALYIEVKACSAESCVRVVIEDLHTNITLIEKDGRVVFQSDLKVENADSGAASEEISLTEKAVWDFAMNLPADRGRFILDAVRMNSLISETGLKGHFGMEVGRSVSEDISKGYQAEDLVSRAVQRTAAAVDARMDGCELPVMSNSGSGNQGITATMPVVVVAEEVKADEERLVRALLLSHLTTIHMKSSLGRLSALCGATIAASGAACGVVYLLGGGYKEVEMTIKNMVGNVAGMICDGAKFDCALKVASTVQAGMKAAFMALGGHVVSPVEGIVHKDVEVTIRNLGILGSRGMKETDRVILNMMLEK